MLIQGYQNANHTSAIRVDSILVSYTNMGNATGDVRFMYNIPLKAGETVTIENNGTNINPSSIFIPYY